ncbi:MAG: protein kinase [Cyanobacteria bacterium J06632_22]
MTPKRLAHRYELIEQLGEGSYGITYRAIDHHTPELSECVVKALQHQDTDILERFKKEAVALQKLGQHPHIPQLLAYFEEGGQFYIVQERVVGHDLSKEIYSGRRLSEGYVTKLLKDVLTTLAYVHKQGSIHRDIKPSNLIRKDSNGDIFLVDFGLVKQLSVSQIDEHGKLFSTVTVGTTGYLAPEQEVAGKVSFASDLYAVGMLAIAALTGISPHRLDRDPYLPQVNWRSDAVDVHPALAKFIDKLIAPNPKRRYRTAQQALNALKRIQNGIAVGNNSRFATWRVAPAGSASLPPEEVEVRDWVTLSNWQVAKIMGGVTAALLLLGLGVKTYQYGFSTWQRSLPQATATTLPTYEAANPDTLVDLLDDGSIKVQPEVVVPFWQMVNAAKEDEITLYPLAGYLSIAEQQQRRQAQGVDIDSSQLKHSDYQTGYAVAIADLGAERSTDWDKSFQQTAGHRWLKENAPTYGFELSYPKGNPAGDSEPWHWRYEGTDE